MAHRSSKETGHAVVTDGLGDTMLASAIGYARRRLTISALTRRMLSLMAGLALFPLLVVIADHFLAGGLPRAVIFGAGILWAVVTLFGVAGVSVRTIARRVNDVFLARYVERAHGIRHNPLINTVLAGRGGEAAYVRGVAAHQAAVALDDKDWRDISGEKLRRPFFMLLFALGLWALYASISPKPILPSLARMAGVNRAAPTATRIALLRPTPEQAVYAGEPLEIEFRVSGRSVDSGVFELRDSAGELDQPRLRREINVGGGDDDRDRLLVSLAANEVSGDLQYRCIAGDARLEGVIRVLSRAELVALEVKLTPPAYVGEPVRLVRDGDLDAWSGTRAEFVATANVEIADPVFVHRGEAETRTRMSVSPANPRQATLSTTLLKSGTYWLEFSDMHGRECRDPRVWRMLVRRDASPTVEIVSPSREEAPGDVVDVTQTAILRVTASDDVGLAEVVAATDRNGNITKNSIFHEPRASARVVLRGGNIAKDSVFNGENARDGRAGAQLEIPTDGFDLAVGESAVVWFEATDGRRRLDDSPSPQTARSRSLMLIRSSELEPRDSGEDLADKGRADAAVAETEVEKRATPGDGDGGGDKPIADNGGGASSESGGADGGESYRPAPEGDAADESDSSDPLDPQTVVQDGAGGESDKEGAGDGGEGANDPNSPDAADQQFNEELRKFDKEHGDEAGEVRKVLGQRADQQEANEPDTPNGEKDGGENGAERDPLEQDSQQGSNLDEQASDSADDPNAAAGQRSPIDLKEKKAPGSEQAESDSPDKDDASNENSEGETKRESPADRAEPKPADQPTAAADQPSPEDQDQPDNNAADSSNTQSENAQPESKQEKDGADPEAGAEEQNAGDAEADAGEQSPEQDSADESASDGQPESEARDKQAPAAPGAPDAAGETTVPMPAQRPLGVKPTAEPDAPSNADLADIAGSTARPGGFADSLELLARGEDISDDDLAELGWPPAKRLAFIEAFERLRQSARRAGALSDVLRRRMHAELGSANVERGAGVSGGLSNDVSSESRPRSGLDQIAPDREQRVSPELRAILDAYYRSLAQRAREKP